MSTAIRSNDLHFSYDAQSDPIINGLNLNIPEGSVTAILGPNGCGKTTFLLILLGILSPDQGQIHYFGKSANAYEPKILKQRIGMVSQNEKIPFDLSVKEYVLLGRAPHLPLLGRPNIDDLRIAEQAIETAGIKDKAHRSVPQLSSGEKQLVSIARALAQAPDIFLFDEPTSHLDLPNSRKILTLMRQIADQSSKTVVFTTHDPNAAAAIADNMALFGRGRMIASGKTADVFTEENLSATYGEELEILQTERGPVILAI